MASVDDNDQEKDVYDAVNGDIDVQSDKINSASDLIHSLITDHKDDGIEHAEQEMPHVSDSSDGNDDEMPHPDGQANVNGLKHLRHNSNVVTIDDDDSGNFVIIGGKGNAVKNVLLVAKIVALVVVVAAVILAVIFFCYFSVVPGKIQGASYSIGNFSVLPSNFEPNLDELQPGDKVIVKNSFGIPFTSMGLEELMYSERNGAMLLCVNQKNSSDWIEENKIAYVVEH
jgi:hypothetical protein